MNVLLLLPTDLACVVLTEWLKLEHVVRLDSAFANKEARPIFLESILKSPNCVIRHVSYVSRDSVLLKWLNSRGLRVSELIFARINYVYMESGSLVYFKNFGYTNVKYLLCKVALYCNNLVSLGLVECFVHESVLDVLRCCRKLENFIVMQCFEWFSDNFAAGEHVVTNISNLALDVVWRNQSAVRAVQQYIAPSYSYLKRLFLCYNHIHGEPLQTIVINGLENLRCFGFGHSYYIDDDLFLGTTTSCPNVIRLDISFCGRLTDACLNMVAHHLTQLQSINIYKCSFTDFGLNCLAQHCKGTLERLFAGKCKNMTGTGLNVVLTHCRKLHTLWLSLLPNVTDSLDTTLLGNIGTLQTDWEANNEISAMLRFFHGLVNLYIGDYDYDRGGGDQLLVLSDVSLPSLRSIVLGNLNSNSAAYGYGSNWWRKEAVAAVADLQTQRPHLNIRFGHREHWPSNMMVLPV